MARPGRKRKDGERHPSGQFVREDIGVVAEYGRLKDQARRGAADARWENPLGRLHYMGKIVDAQRAAGEDFGELVRQFRRIGLDAPSEFPKISNMQPHIPGTTHADYPESIIERITKRYVDTCRSVMDMPQGVKILTLLHDVCANNLEPAHETGLFKQGLDRLCVVWNMNGISHLRKK